MTIASISAIVAEDVFSMINEGPSSKIYKLIGRKGKTTLPFEVCKHLNLDHNSLISYELKDENLVILRKERDGGGNEVDANEGNLVDLVNSLTDTEQRHLLHYLTIIISKKENDQCL